MVSPELHRSIVNKVRATAVRHLLDQVKTQFAPHLAVALFIAWLVWDHADRLHLLLWLGSYLGLVYTAEAGAWIYSRRHPVRDDQIEAWERFWLALKSTNSLYVGYAYYAFALGGPREDLFMLVMVAIMYTAAQYSRGDMKMASGMVIPIYAGVLAAHLSRGTERDFVYAGMFTLAFGSAFSLVLQQSKQAFEAFYARFLNEELAAVLQRKHDELARAKLEVEVASHAKSRFFAAASHDLRQPLHALSLLLGTLQHKVKQLNVLPALQQMEAAIESLESLFHDVLDVARLESGKTDVRIVAVSSRRLLQRLQWEFEAIAGAKGLELRFCGPDVLLQTDEMLLKRILINLISNAIKYTDRGGVLVACRRSKPQGTARLQVFDTGTGIAAAEIDHIFEDFYQASLPEAERRRQREGVGLGLGIVKRLADLLDYPVEVRSRPGQGSRFELRVPMSRVAATVPEAREDTEAIASLSFAGRSILVVDDEEVVVNAMAALLSDWGAKVLTATSRAQLQDVLGALSVAPDFLIVDYQFEPAWTGEDAILAVRENFGCAVPAAVMTGNVALVPERVARSGRVHVFAKPVSPAKLRALLRFSLEASP
jgi:signal transduction histidine kinase